MIRIKMERRLKKKRTENWTPDEKNLLKRLIKDRYDRYAAIENKNNSTSANLMKSEAWKRIWEKFVVENRRPRTVQNLRDQWKRMKARRITTNKEFQSNSEAVDGESDHNDDPLGQDTNISDEIPLKQFKCVRDDYNETRDNMSQNGSPKPKHLITQMFQKHKGGIEYKRSLLELNKVVKEQITNCAIEEHTLRMSQLKEEHEFRMKTMNELHQLECDNKRLQAQLMSLDIEIKKKQLNNFVL